MSIRAKLLSTGLRLMMKRRFEKPDVDQLRKQDPTLPGKLPPEVRTEVVDAGGVPCEWVSFGEAADTAPVLMYLHGGGYVFGGPDSHRGITWRLARESGARVLVVDYRLAPEHQFPAPVEDACKAYQWLLEQGVEATRLAIGGDSAGGGLSLATMVNLRSHGLPLPCAAILLSPWTDLSGSGPSVAENARKDPMLSPSALDHIAALYLGDRSRRAPLASPLFADLQGLPPTLVQVGSTEILLSDSQRVVKAMKRLGVSATLEVWPGMPHVWQIFSGFLPEGEQAIAALGVFLRGQFAAATTATTAIADTTYGAD